MFFQRMATRRQTTQNKYLVNNVLETLKNRILAVKRNSTTILVNNVLETLKTRIFADKSNSTTTYNLVWVTVCHY